MTRSARFATSLLFFRRSLASAGLLIAGATIPPSASYADDWPQWMGPQRDNVWRETDIVSEFPESGLPVVWRTPVAGGYAGPAVANGRVFLTDYVTKDNVQVDNFQRETFTGIERVLCFEEETGKQLWKHEYPVTYTVSYPAGPRCTPTVDEDRVYTLGTEGNLFCFSVSDGSILWEKNLVKEYQTKTALWGYASHPLVDGNKLICVVGGEGSHTVAFDKLTGKELWRSLTATEQGYCPPTIVSVGDQRQLIVARPDGVSGVDPESGKELWATPYEANNGSIIMSPIMVGDYLYVAGYSNRNLLLELSANNPNEVKVLWKDKNRKGISPVNVQPFVEGNLVYGFDQGGELMAIELPSGDRLWETAAPIGRRASGSDTAFMVRHQDRFFLFNEHGDLIIAKLSRDGYAELDRTHIIDPTGVAFGRDIVWCPPAYANKRIYVRNDKELIAVDLAAKK
jgi:outer membrane protein assembly factor BamB